jgi:antitoxin VapB
MALYLNNAQAERLAREVADLTGETLTEAVRVSLEQRLRHEKLKRGARPWDDAAIEAIVRRAATLPLLDPRSPEEILYGDDGLPR